MTPSLANSLLASLLALGACRAPEAQGVSDWPPMVAGEMGSMDTVAYAEELWFGSAPDADALRLARRRGVERVIDLCPRGGPDLRAVAEGVGLAWVAIPIPVEAAADGTVDEVLAALRAPQRTLMFCSEGDVSAALFAIHRAVQVGVPLEAALQEARRAGLDPDPGEALVRRQVARLSAARP